MTTRPVLNLAVRGKLVPQDPNEEPASELLKRIAAENKMLMATKGIRSQKPTLPAENFEVDSEIPPTWCHVYLQDIAYQTPMERTSRQSIPRWGSRFCQLKT
jgi:type I restriction enzyme S subunit